MSTQKPSRAVQHKALVQDVPEQEHLGLERLIFFSDAVFAIAITLLVLEIRLPSGEAALTDAELLASLLGIWQKYLAYMISFLVIGMFWMSHHRKFRYIKRYDSRLLFLNLLMLMVVAFVPFPSSIISESPSRTATIFYALTMIVVGLLFLLLWWYASRNNYLTDPQLDPNDRRREFAVPLMTMAVFLLSIGITFVNADLAKFSWLLLLPISLYMRRQ